MTTVFLNMKTNQGVETIDEFSREENQNSKDFRKYVSEMIKEYHLCNMHVYKSTRCTKEWKNK